MIPGQAKPREVSFSIVREKHEEQQCALKQLNSSFSTHKICFVSSWLRTQVVCGKQKNIRIIQKWNVWERLLNVLPFFN